MCKICFASWEWKRVDLLQRYLLTIYLVYSFVDGTETQQVSPIRLNVLFEVFHAYKHVWNTCSKYVLSDLFLMNDRPEAVFCIPDISD